MQQRMKATRSFRYATRMLQAGDEFDATRQDARVLAAIGRADLVEPPKAKPAPKEAEVEAPEEAHDDAEDEPVKRRRGRPAKSRD